MWEVMPQMLGPKLGYFLFIYLLIYEQIIHGQTHQEMHKNIQIHVLLLLFKVSRYQFFSFMNLKVLALILLFLLQQRWKFVLIHVLIVIKV